MPNGPHLAVREQDLQIQQGKLLQLAVADLSVASLLLTANLSREHLAIGSRTPSSQAPGRPGVVIECNRPWAEEADMLIWAEAEDTSGPFHASIRSTK